MMQIPLFFIGTFTLTTLSLFNLGINGMFVNRTFLNMPISILDCNVLSIKTEENNEIITNYYFDQDSLKEEVKNYLSNNLKSKVSNYKIGFNFFNYDEKIITEDVDFKKCNAVQMHFISNYYFNYKINSYISFYIEKGIIYNEG